MGEGVRACEGRCFTSWKCRARLAKAKDKAERRATALPNIVVVASHALCGRLGARVSTCRPLTGGPRPLLSSSRHQSRRATGSSLNLREPPFHTPFCDIQSVSNKMASWQRTSQTHHCLGRAGPPYPRGLPPPRVRPARHAFSNSYTSPTAWASSTHCAAGAPQQHQHDDVSTSADSGKGGVGGCVPAAALACALVRGVCTALSSLLWCFAGCLFCSWRPGAVETIVVTAGGYMSSRARVLPRQP